MDRRTLDKANYFFIREEVFNSEERTGIMIFVSMFEHRVIVMADEGINKVVPPHTWNEVVDIIVKGIKTRDLTDGLIKGIQKCAEILKHHELLITDDDINELPDSLRTE